MDWLKDEFSKSNIISGFLAIIVWLAVIYLAIMQLPVPEILYFGGASVIAFFFGSKQGRTEGHTAALRELAQLERRVYDDDVHGD